MSNLFRLTYLFIILSIFACESKKTTSDSEITNEDQVNRQERIDSILQMAEENTNKPNDNYDELTDESRKDKKLYEDQTYYLIVGSFSKYDNAMAMIKEFEGSELIVGTDKLNRVSVSTLNNLDEAVQAIRAFKKQYPKIPAWLYTK